MKRVQKRETLLSFKFKTKKDYLHYLMMSKIFLIYYIIRLLCSYRDFLELKMYYIVTLCFEEKDLTVKRFYV